MINFNTIRFIRTHHRFYNNNNINIFDDNKNEKASKKIERL